ncbi:hypothetical protein HHK36_005649 [Tetracentron sinense]|uniref:Uncharacterized protein n=1 Tax=Tetracentron sinense TaxID=13715 RepID=A0A834ZLT9_TETSI|nr:hypothetical protein HHK36_005649 [Tetracentron sinense]
MLRAQEIGLRISLQKNHPSTELMSSRILFKPVEKCRGDVLLLDLFDSHGVVAVCQRGFVDLEETHQKFRQIRDQKMQTFIGSDEELVLDWFHLRKCRILDRLDKVTEVRGSHITETVTETGLSFSRIPISEIRRSCAFQRFSNLGKVDSGIPQVFSLFSLVRILGSAGYSDEKSLLSKYFPSLEKSSMADMYGFGARSMRDEEFDEEDVWAAVKERKESSPKFRKSKDPSSVSTPWRLPTATRMIPRANNFSHEAKVLQQSAPVNIPEWSKIYRKNSNKGYTDGSWVDASDGVANEDEGINGVSEDDDDKVPPHEWIAKKLARNQMSSFSVCEGIGRTLKGRDLRKVRNAVLTRTGFLE